jgi:hypothetical protein
MSFISLSALIKLMAAHFVSTLDVSRKRESAKPVGVIAEGKYLAVDP